MVNKYWEGEVIALNGRQRIATVGQIQEVMEDWNYGGSCMCM
jgi:hypothetical protein